MAYQDETALIKIGKQVLQEDDLRIEVKYKDETFVLHYPTPLERSQIEAEVARRLGGLDRGAYPPAHVQLVEACTYVDSLYIADLCPGWYQGPWTCMDEVLTATLFAGYLRFRSDFTDRLNKGGFQRDSKDPKS